MRFPKNWRSTSIFSPTLGNPERNAPPSYRSCMCGLGLFVCLLHFLQLLGLCQALPLQLLQLLRVSRTRSLLRWQFKQIQKDLRKRGAFRTCETQATKRSSQARDDPVVRHLACLFGGLPFPDRHATRSWEMRRRNKFNRVLQSRERNELRPSQVARPVSKSKTLSKRVKTASEGWWIVATTVQPCSVICFTSLMRESDILESKPLVGSSSNSREGLPNRDRATFVRFLSPPEIPRTRPGEPTTVSAHFFRLSFSITLSTSHSQRERERESEAKRTLQHSAALSFCS